MKQPNIVSLFSRYVAKTVGTISKQDSIPAAVRVQFLNSIDKDYSHMLKNTLKMEKDHTRKNYEFQRNFQRDKYINRDAILKEKRFQSSFSHLWRSNNVSHHRANQVSTRKRHSRRLGMDTNSHGNSPGNNSLYASQENEKRKKPVLEAALSQSIKIRR